VLDRGHNRAVNRSTPNVAEFMLFIDPPIPSRPDAV
jgi:hypothetical protein